VVKLLLERKDINIDIPDHDGRTPLSWAAGNGYVEVVELQLGRHDIDAETPDRNGKTPLSRAVTRGRAAVVTLLQRHINMRADSNNISMKRVLTAAADEEAENSGEAGAKRQKL
jgi:ankyrin repeat protein